ncbi:MAG: hypothetical protein KBH36_03210, partial [Acidaminococcaceae bacterium]|nr:hypothetical protein [Acidaminococcaceae bacterium]
IFFVHIRINKRLYTKLKVADGKSKFHICLHLVEITLKRIKVFYFMLHLNPFSCFSYAFSLFFSLFDAYVENENSV